MRIREFEELRTVFTLYDQDIEHKDEARRCSRVKHIVKRFLEQKIRGRNFEAGNDRTTSGAPTKQKGNGETKSGDRKQGDCDR